MQGLEDSRRGAFSYWLRTGRRVASPKDRDVEHKFNPWHDPRDGKFTFAGAGRYAAGGSRASTPPVGRHVPKIEYAEDFSRPPVASLAEADAWRARELAKYRGDKDAAAAIQARYQRYRQAFAPRSDEALQSVASRTADFARGVGDGVFDTAKGTATGLYALATTNPLTTARKVGRGIAEAIDSAIAAEDVPASIQIGRTANSIANASAYDIGHAVGAVGGNVGLTVGPGALAGKIARAGRRAGVAESLATAERGAPEVTWVDESNGLKNPAKDYNDSATGARSNVETRRGQAPALKRAMSDGTTRFVKFDGVDGRAMIDRKWSIARSRKAKDQALRQSDVLKQHGLIGIWEVPTEFERRQAMKLLENLEISNIKVRVIEAW